MIYANTGMDFPKSLNAISPDRLDQFILVGDSIKKEISDFNIQGKSLTAKYSLEKPGSYVVAASIKPKEIKLTAKEFNEYLLHDGLGDIYKLREKEGLLDNDAIEHYDKYPKTIIQVGTIVDDTPTKPLNLPIEILPVINPYKLKRGDKLTVIVLFRGKPLANAELAWTYPHQGEKFAGTTSSDDEGKAVIPLEKVGPYVIRLTHMEWVKKKNHQWESYWSSLTFEVLPD